MVELFFVFMNMKNKKINDNCNYFTGHGPHEKRMSKYEHALVKLKEKGALVYAGIIRLAGIHRR